MEYGVILQAVFTCKTVSIFNLLSVLNHALFMTPLPFKTLSCFIYFLLSAWILSFFQLVEYTPVMDH